jgi:hypothetical protein
MRGRVFVDATGIDKYWTGKAANRAGFENSNDPEGVRIKISKRGDHKKWIVNTDLSTIEFGSIYELVNWLNSQ